MAEKEIKTGGRVERKNGREGKRQRGWKARKARKEGNKKTIAK